MHTSDILLELSPSEGGLGGEYRTIGDRILSGKVKVPADQVRSAEAWKKLQLHCTSPADIRVVDANIWKEHHPSLELLESVYAWLQKAGLPDLRETASECGSLCKAALFHHDISAFSDSVFCVVWLEKSAGLDLVLPQLGKRVPLHLGTVVVFDAAQPHAVLYSGDELFEPHRYLDLPPQAFLALDFNALTPGVPAAMGVSVRETADGWPGAVVLMMQDGPEVDAVTGEWRKSGDYVRPPRAAANPAR